MRWDFLGLRARARRARHAEERQAEAPSNLEPQTDLDEATHPPPPSEPPNFPDPSASVVGLDDHVPRGLVQPRSHVLHQSRRKQNQNVHQSHHLQRPHAPEGRPQQHAQPQHTSHSHARPHHTQASIDQLLDQAQHPLFQYSRCTGRRKALCIGINYTGQRDELHGCVNDAKNVYFFLRKHHRFQKEDMVLLRDDARHDRDVPTRRNIIDAMRWLVRDAQPHDSLFIHYSGHGGQTKDLDGDEVDGLDEVIFPLDFRKAGQIVDDEIHAVMVKPLPPGCRLTALFDSCHSGSVLDLPFLYHPDGRVKRSQVTRRFRALKSTPADVISWSGCKDSQTSADTYEGGLAVGAMSYAFMLSLNRSPDQTYQQVLTSVTRILRNKYSQKPQLSSSHRINTHLKFII